MLLACDVRIRSASGTVLRISLHRGRTRGCRTGGRPQAAAAIVLFGEPIDGDRAAEIGLVALRAVASLVPAARLAARAARRSRCPRRRSSVAGAVAPGRGAALGSPRPGRSARAGSNPDLTRPRFG
jgi:enoyl-CoA hydratase/carnithine racemase